MTNIRQKITDTEIRQKDIIIDVLGSLDIKPRCIRYYFEAFTHKSYKAENDWPYNDNERLEYLGDSIIETAISLFLFEKHINASEGDLSILRSVFVRGESLTGMTMKLKLYPVLLLSNGETIKARHFIEEYKCKKPFSVNYDPYGNLFEAFIAAYVMDIGVKTPIRWLKQIFNEMFLHIKTDRFLKDSKTKLQEVTQKCCHEKPDYKTFPDIAGIKNGFYSEVYLEKQFLGCGHGKTKKEAQQCAAQGALNKFKRATQSSKDRSGQE
ncbi:MAG: hypothetical protein KAH01_00605 [Caldisericia bacterium]|nr:hypothetical protein [Caldisericia bacterium]